MCCLLTRLGLKKTGAPILTLIHDSNLRTDSNRQPKNVRTRSKVSCIAVSPNKLHQCSIDELTIEVLTADVHLHTVPGTFDGTGVDPG